MGRVSDLFRATGRAAGARVFRLQFQMGCAGGKAERTDPDNKTNSGSPSSGDKSSASASVIPDDYVFKVLVFGECDVGKTSLLVRLCTGELPENPDEYFTTTDPHKTVSVETDGVKSRLQLWDTAGQERFRTMTSTFYTGADGIVLVCDITNQRTFSNL